MSSTCSLFGVRRQVYYRAKKAQTNSRQKASVVVEMVKEKRKSMRRLGTRKLYEQLYEPLRQMGVGRDRLFDILRANHMHIVAKRQYQVTTNSHHRFRKHKNLVEGLEIKRPEQVFVSDITYIGSREHPMYLALITDAYSKRIMGYNVSDSLNATGAVTALKMALKNRKYKREALIHHSDRGIQYCGNDYQQILQKHSIKCSMTEKYDPYQNAVAERVNGIIKQEFLEGILVRDVELMDKIMKESIQLYNQERPHLSCHMLTPDKMHQQRKLKMKTYKRK
ncbi:IS3 family transposase, partial [Nafulsella turpanensis]|uniref:IS3 family transposase n=1 Tax=Nafulsella turpanensis TaxID=1265690 RepID=UPI000368B460